jgi:hypothetical protein
MNRDGSHSGPRGLGDLSERGMERRTRNGTANAEWDRDRAMERTAEKANRRLGLCRRLALNGLRANL